MNILGYSNEELQQRGTKYLSEEDQEFVDSIYSLFGSFRDSNMDFLAEIREARQIRKLKDPEYVSGDPNKQTCPQLNTLNSTMDNMIADYVDNRPEVIVVPEAQEKELISRGMTDVMGCVLHHANMPEAWRQAVEDAVVVGTGVIQDFYDEDMSVGGVEGNIGMIYWPAESWLPDPLTCNYQDGRAVFKVCTQPLSWFYQHYPNLAEYIDPDGESRLDYERDEADQRAISTDDPLVCILEVWYRRYNAEKKRYEIHMAKVAGGVLLEDSRSNDETADGIYAHGMYPFTVLRFRERKDSAYGTGMVYDFKETQRMINRCIKYIDDNGRMASRFKLLVSKQAGVNKADLLDANKEIVEVDQRIDKTFIDWFQPQALNSLIPNAMGVLQDTMKQDSGQNQWARGEGGQGVTAASAIAQLATAGGKISRMHIESFLGQFRGTCERIVSMIGQFFKEKRIFTIYGDQGGTDIKQVTFDRSEVFGGLSVYKKPAFTVRIVPQKSSPDQMRVFNETVLKMVELSANSGSPIPAHFTAKALQMAGKEQIIPILEQADAQAQMLQQLQQQVQMLAEQNQQLQEQFGAVQQDAENKRQMLMAVGQQMAGQGRAQQPSLSAPQGA
jgi:hypothetical protein